MSDTPLYRSYQKPISERISFIDREDYTRIIPFKAVLYADEAGPQDVIFQVDSAKTVEPVRTIPTEPFFVQRGVIHEIAFRMNPTNAATYAFMLFEGGKANLPYGINSKLLYESPALLVDDTDYVLREQQIPFILDEVGLFRYNIDWSAAPGVTPGYIRISGMVMV